MTRKSELHSLFDGDVDRDADGPASKKRKLPNTASPAQRVVSEHRFWTVYTDHAQQKIYETLKEAILCTACSRGMRMAGQFMQR